MAIFLLVAAVFNLWFVVTSYIRARSHRRSAPPPSQQLPTDDEGADEDSSAVSCDRAQLLNYSVLTMALFDILWVWCCMVQCWYNTFHDASSASGFNQNAGPDSVGCKFMGWYSSFSLVSMMGSHCLVVYHLRNVLTGRDSTLARLLASAGCILVGAALFASMPLMLQGGDNGGYLLTNGGFCYADFTNPVQASVMLGVVVSFLLLAAALWCGTPGGCRKYYVFTAVFFVTWTMWVPATSYGIATGEQIPSPYMIIGAIVGHGNALLNPLLYGISLYRILQQQTASSAAGDGDIGGIGGKGVALIDYDGRGKSYQDNVIDDPQVSIGGVA